MPELHPLLAGRWSPCGFDIRHEVGRTELASLLEAARWAPSEGNGQPWRFVIGRRDDEPYKRIFECLDPDEQRWAWRASALIAAGYATPHSRLDDAGPIKDTAVAYDLGQAIAHLGVQAMALRLHTHQMAGLDAVRLHRELELPCDVAVHTVVAVGRLGDPSSLPTDLRRREFRLRERRPVSDLVLASAL
jgi:nitroreductase